MFDIIRHVKQIKNAMKQYKLKQSTLNRFINGKMRKSDFTFRWKVFRSNYTDWPNFFAEARKTGLLNDIENKMDSNNAWHELVKKHSKPWYVYSLERVCIQQEPLFKAMDAMLSKDQKKAFLNSKSIKSLVAAIRSENKKRRRFSSLSNMQKYVNKNGITDENGNVLDVHALWESMKTSDS